MLVGCWPLEWRRHTGDTILGACQFVGKGGGWLVTGLFKRALPFENQRLLAWKKDPFWRCSFLSNLVVMYVSYQPFMFGTATLPEVDGLVDFLKQRSYRSCRRVRHVSVATWPYTAECLRIRSSITLCEVLEAKWYPKSWSSLVRSIGGGERNLTEFEFFCASLRSHPQKSYQNYWKLNARIVQHCPIDEIPWSCFFGSHRVAYWISSTRTYSTHLHLHLLACLHLDFICSYNWNLRIDHADIVQNESQW